MEILPFSSLDVMLGKVAVAEKSGRKIIKMLAGEPDFDTPLAIKEAAIKALNGGDTHYVSASGVLELKSAIVRNFQKRGVKTDVSNILISPGARFCVFAAVAAVCGEGDEVIVLKPYWNGYNGIIAAAGAVLVAVPLEGLFEAITARTKMIIVNSPGNPSGEVYSCEVLSAIAKLAAECGIYVLSDEIYGELVYDGVEQVSIASLPEADLERVIIVDGFSKTYAMTGWRLGYMAAPEVVLKRAAALQMHITHSPTSFAQAGAIEALSGRGDGEIVKMRESFRRRRDMLCAGLEEIGCESRSCSPLLMPLVRLRAIDGITQGLSQLPEFSPTGGEAAGGIRMWFERPRGAFYVLLHVGMDAEKFADRLLAEHDLAVMPCADFGASDAVRLSYACSEEDLKEALARLKLFVSAVSQPS